MTDSRPAATDRGRWSIRRITGGIIGAAIGFVIVLWFGGNIPLALVLGCGLGFVIGLRVARSRSWKGGDRPDSPYHAPLSKVGRGGSGDMTPGG